MELDELREELKRQRSEVMATMLGQKILSQSTVHKLAVLQTAIEAVSAVIAAGGIRDVGHSRRRPRTTNAVSGRP